MTTGPGGGTGGGPAPPYAPDSPSNFAFFSFPAGSVPSTPLSTLAFLVSPPVSCGVCEEISRKNICFTINNNMGFEKGDRVYISSSKTYANVTKTRFLGKPGVLVSSDNGESLAFDEARTNAEIYSKETGKNGDGDEIQLPMDVQVEGVGILTSLNISPAEQKLFFLKFIIGLTQDEKESRVNEFNSVKGDEVLKRAFLDRLLDELDDDQSLVSREGSKALFNIRDDIRGNMFQKLMTEFPQEQREQLMLEWMSAKNERNAKEAFLHEMYCKLMLSDEYILTEGIRAMTSIGMDGDKQKALFAKFLQTSDESTKQQFIEQWKLVRGSNSRKRSFLKKIIRKLEADA